MKKWLIPLLALAGLFGSQAASAHDWRHHERWHHERWHHERWHHHHHHRYHYDHGRY